MEHVVFHPGPDAAPAFRRFASLDEAVRFVEHLRNVEGVTEVSLHALTPVPVAFRAYYRVEVPGEAAEAVEAAPDAPAVVPADLPEQPVVAIEPLLEAPALMPDPVEAVAAEMEPEPAANGKRSLGFFAH